MDVIKKIMKKIAKNIMLLVLSAATLAMTFYTIVKAVDSVDNLDSSGDDTDAKLTSEEIDKIIDDLKISGDIDNITEKLDEIIERAKKKRDVP